MSAVLLQCMGGWCRQRASCAHYVAPPVPGREPAERLCGPEEKREPVRQPAPVVDLCKVL